MFSNESIPFSCDQASSSPGIRARLAYRRREMQATGLGQPTEIAGIQCTVNEHTLNMKRVEITGGTCRPQIITTPISPGAQDEPPSPVAN